jgi:hypothetical protein
VNLEVFKLVLSSNLDGWPVIATTSLACSSDIDPLIDLMSSSMGRLFADNHTIDVDGLEIIG